MLDIASILGKSTGFFCVDVDIFAPEFVFMLLDLFDVKNLVCGCRNVYVFVILPQV